MESRARRRRSRWGARRGGQHRTRVPRRCCVRVGRASEHPCGAARRPAPASQHPPASTHPHDAEDLASRRHAGLHLLHVARLPRRHKHGGVLARCGGWGGGQSRGWASRRQEREGRRWTPACPLQLPPARSYLHRRQQLVAAIRLVQELLEQLRAGRGTPAKPRAGVGAGAGGWQAAAAQVPGRGWMLGVPGAAQGDCRSLHIACAALDARQGAASSGGESCPPFSRAAGASPAARRPSLLQQHLGVRLQISHSGRERASRRAEWDKGCRTHGRLCCRADERRTVPASVETGHRAVRGWSGPPAILAGHICARSAAWPSGLAFRCVHTPSVCWRSL